MRGSHHCVRLAGHAGITLFGWQTAGLPDAPRGLAASASATVVTCLLLLYPGLHTPGLSAQAGRAAVQGAAPYDPDGTPIVAVNGRHATSFALFLYAIVLTRGSPDHPAFARLPPPNPNAHLH